MTRRQRHKRILAGATLIGAASLFGTYGRPEPMTARLNPARRHGPAHFHQRWDQTVSDSYNWGGYAVTGATGSFTDAKGSWIVPQVNCASTPAGYAASWVGIDGWSSSTVEQIGTDSDCVSPSGTTGTPTYYAWFEFYPQPGYYIGNPSNNFAGYAVKAGDVMTAEVKAGARTRRGQVFTVTIEDTTASPPWIYQTSYTMKGAQQSSAEWIMESPYGCNSPSGPSYCPLSNFGVDDYGDAFPPHLLGSGSYATMNNVAQALGSFQNVQQVNIVSYPSGTVTMATPGPLTSNSQGKMSSFLVNWMNVGP
jgi:hypothetical protein